MLTSRWWGTVCLGSESVWTSTMGRAGGACTHGDSGRSRFQSETNRALILAALASGPSVIRGGLEA